MLKLLLSLSLILNSLNPPAHSAAVTPLIPKDNRIWESHELLSVAAIPYKTNQNPAPEILAQSALAIDLDSGKVLFEKNGYEKRAIASLTKLMTAIVTLEDNDPSEIVTVGPNATQVEEVKIWLLKGEKITVKDLIYGALIPSGNDAAIALAEHNAGSEQEFVTKMNAKAQLLGLENTSFVNVTGLDQEGDKNTSTDYELALLATYALNKTLIREATSTKNLTIISLDNISHNLESTNKLLDTGYFKGLKTGNTLTAGLCFIGLAEKDGHEILAVILNSDQRFEDSEKLAEWVYNTYVW